MIEVLKQALEALEKSKAALAEELSAWDIDPPLHHVLEAHDLCDPAIASLRQTIREHAMYEVQRLGQEIEQEPVAWADHGVVNWIADKQFKHASSLYTHPPQRTWVGLNDEEATEVYAEVQEKVNEHWEGGGTTMMFPSTLYKAIEAKLKEKNT